jgi:hypothetical protein
MAHWIPTTGKFKIPNLNLVTGIHARIVSAATGGTYGTLDKTLAQLGSPDGEGYYSVSLDEFSPERGGTDPPCKLQVATVGVDGMSEYASSSEYVNQHVPDLPDPPTDVIVTND